MCFPLSRSIVEDIANALQEDALQALHEALEWKKAQTPERESQIGNALAFVHGEVWQQIHGSGLLGNTFFCQQRWWSCLLSCVTIRT